jgi:hypothetical protein
MSAQFRPTDPQGPPVAGQVLLNPEILSQVLRAAGLRGVGLYGQICAAAQHREPCSVELLMHANRGEEREVRRALVLLLRHAFIEAVAEPEEGGAA